MFNHVPGASALRRAPRARDLWREPGLGGRRRGRPATSGRRPAPPHAQTGRCLAGGICWTVRKRPPAPGPPTRGTWKGRAAQPSTGGGRQGRAPRGRRGARRAAAVVAVPVGGRRRQRPGATHAIKKKSDTPPPCPADPSRRGARRDRGVRDRLFSVSLSLSFLQAAVPAPPRTPHQAGARSRKRREPPARRHPPAAAPQHARRPPPPAAAVHRGRRRRLALAAAVAGARAPTTGGSRTRAAGGAGGRPPAGAPAIRAAPPRPRAARRVDAIPNRLPPAARLPSPRGTAPPPFFPRKRAGTRSPPRAPAGSFPDGPPLHAVALFYGPAYWLLCLYLPPSPRPRWRARFPPTGFYRLSATRPWSLRPPVVAPDGTAVAATGLGRCHRRCRPSPTALRVDAAASVADAAATAVVVLGGATATGSARLVRAGCTGAGVSFSCGASPHRNGRAPFGCACQLFDRCSLFWSLLTCACYVPPPPPVRDVLVSPCHRSEVFSRTTISNLAPPPARCCSAMVGRGREDGLGWTASAPLAAR